MKVEAFMQLASIPYRPICLGNPNKGPKGKLPFIKDGTEIVADSGFIVKYLTTKYQCTIDDHLSPAQRATGVAINRMLDEHLYWAIVYSRWIDKRTWPLVKEQFFGRLPVIAKQLVPFIARRQVQRYLYGHGMGRHGAKEIWELASEDFGALSDQLGPKEYIFGSRPCGFDATLYAFLAAVIETSLDTPLKAEAVKYQNLVDYCSNMKQTIGGQGDKI